MEESPRIKATYVAQVDVDEDTIAATGKEEKFNVTRTILRMPVQQIVDLMDDHDSSDDLVAEASTWAKKRSLKHPFAIRIEEALEDFFDLYGYDLRTLTQEQVDLVREQLDY